MNKIKKLIEKIGKPYVMVLIGPPLSGKTTFLKNFIEDDTYKHISSDALVLSLDKIQDGDYNRAWKEADWKLINKTLKSEILESYKNRDNVVFDLTNLTHKRRRSNLSNFSKDYYKIAVIFPILSDNEYLYRNSKRNDEENKNMSMHVIRRMISSYQPIRDNEGFDRVISL